jgi:methyl coenzyme M reductase alpha subunit
VFSCDSNTEITDILRKKRKREHEKAKEAAAENEDTNANQPKLKKLKPRRVEGKYQLEEYIKYVEGKQKHMARAKASLGQARMNEIYDEIRTTKHKTSAVDVEKKKFEASFGKAENMEIATKNLVAVTAAMDGAVVLRHLNVKNKGKEYLLAELEHRQRQTKWMHLTSAQKHVKKEKELRQILQSR